MIIVIVKILLLLKLVIAQEETMLINNISEVFKNSLHQYDSCKKLYSRSYLPFKGHAMKIPPLLTSLPGSGNSWSRLLIEYASGYYTGSLYGDTTLVEVFPAEKYCGLRMIAIKAHPANLQLLEGERSIWVTDKTTRSLCNKGLIKRFYRMLLLVRNPWNAIYSEFIRRQSAKSMELKFHNTTLNKDMFSANHWIRQALMQTLEAKQFWNKQFIPMINSLSSNIRVFRYEDLLNNSKRINTLCSMLEHINVTNIDLNRVECAFQLADSPSIHRKPSELTIEQVYSDPRLVCQMQSELKQIKVYQELGYNITNQFNINCDNIQPYTKNIGDWIYAINSSIFDIVIRTGNIDFLSKCRYGSDPRNLKWSILLCNPKDIPTSVHSIKI